MQIEQRIEKIDEEIINGMKHWMMLFSKFAIFLIYFWFGILKVLFTSPANPLVASLLERTLPGISFESFIIFFGIFEMLIGIVFIIPRLERLAILLLVIHLATTIMPLFILPQIAWQGFLIPTLEGQYIIKNILIIAIGIGISSHLHIFKKSKKS